jgi:soluble lytic murein transglycosylase-like protein
MRLRVALAATFAAFSGCGIAADLPFLDRAEPAAAAPAAEAPKFSERHLAAVLARRAPKLDVGLRDRLSDVIYAESARGGYDPLFVASLVAVESGFRVRAESSRGARGLVQLKPSTFAWIAAREPDVGGSELIPGEDPIVDVRLAVRYFRWLDQRFKSRDAALYAYNAGPRRAVRYLRSGAVPERVKDYARQIRKEHERLAKLADHIAPLTDPPRLPPKPNAPQVLLAEVLRFVLPGPPPVP